MKVRIPESVPEDREEEYVHAYFSGFKHFRAGGVSYEDSQQARALWPEAYDAGQSAAFYQGAQTINLDAVSRVLKAQAGT
jgi:hypothetical protein